jgi:hypothetical protein
MRPVYLTSVFCAVTFSSLGAALPPLWDSVQELEGFLKDPALKEHFDGSDSILSIERAPGGLLVSTQTKEVWVTVVSKPLEHPGPAQFEYHFEDSRPCQADKGEKLSEEN